MAELSPQNAVTGQIVPISIDLRGSSQADWVQVGEHLAGNDLGKKADHITAVGLTIEMRLRYSQGQQMVLALTTVFQQHSQQTVLAVFVQIFEPVRDHLK